MKMAKAVVIVIVLVAMMVAKMCMKKKENDKETKIEMHCVVTIFVSPSVITLNY